MHIGGTDVFIFTWMCKRKWSESDRLDLYGRAEAAR